MENFNGYNSCILSLSVPLPEDIMKLKWAGEFEQACRVIDRRLKKELPEELRRRLVLEKEILRRIPGQYPYTWQEAAERMRSNIRDFQDEELRELWEEDAADWIYIKGKVHFRDNFLENILKTREDYRKRVIDPEREGMGSQADLLDRTIEEMKRGGGAAREFQMKIRLKIREEAERDNARIRVYLPLPLEYAQVRNVRLSDVLIGGRTAGAEEYTVSAPDSEQRTVCIETIHQPGQTYETEFAFETHMKYVDLSTPRALELAAEALCTGGSDAAGEGRAALTEKPAAETSCADGTGAAGEGQMALPKKKNLAAEQGHSALDVDDPSLYLGERLPHIRFTPYIRGLAREITGEERNPLAKARRIYDFITTRVNYSFVRSYLTLENIPEAAAVSLKGDCGVQALLFITLCRVSGIPARWQSGLFVTPQSAGCHDWAQFYIEPFGWLFADCSFGGSAYRNHAAERWNFYFGNLDPFRLPAAREFQADFVPVSRYLRNDPYDNQTGEAEYEDRGLLHQEYETDFQIEKLNVIAPESGSNEAAVENNGAAATGNSRK